MTPEQFDLLLSIQSQQALALERIAEALEKLAPTEVKAPNIQRSLEEFSEFNWESIGAEVVKADMYGAGIVLWRGKQFMRRSPENEFGASIWFARCVGKSEDGRNKYERLITFSPVQDKKVKPVSREVESLLQR